MQIIEFDYCVFIKISNQILMQDTLSFAASHGLARLDIKNRENRTSFGVNMTILIWDSPGFLKSYLTLNWSTKLILELKVVTRLCLKCHLPWFCLCVANLDRLYDFWGLAGTRRMRTLAFSAPLHLSFFAFTWPLSLWLT